ncbi:MAG: deaminase [Paracoccaceae bacterium]
MSSAQANTRSSLVQSANVLVTPKENEFQNRTSREKNQKYYWIEHAERRVIFIALKQGIDLSQCALAVSLFPCSDCARAIIQSDIRTILAPTIPCDEPRYKETMLAAFEILRAAGVEVIEIKKGFYFNS